MSKWTKEPWTLVPQSNGGYLVAHKYDTGEQMSPTGLRLIAFTMARGNSLEMDEANAVRIVSCVNAMAGLDPEKVLAVVEAAKEYRREADIPLLHKDLALQAIRRKELFAALSSLEQGEKKP